MSAEPGPRRLVRGGPSDDGEDDRVRLLAAVAILRDGAVLMIREEDQPHHHEWVFPQGYPHPRETLAQACRREAFEEVGIDVEIHGLLGIHEEFEGARPATRWTTVCFLGRPVNTTVPVASREAIDSAWVDLGRPEASSLPGLAPWLVLLRQALRR